MLVHSKYGNISCTAISESKSIPLLFRDAKSTRDSLWTSNESSGMAIVLGLFYRLELLEPDACLELEEAIDEREGFGGSRFSV